MSQYTQFPVMVKQSTEIHLHMKTGCVVRIHSLCLKINIKFPTFCLLAFFHTIHSSALPIKHHKDQPLRGQNIPAISFTLDNSGNCVIHCNWEPPSERRLKSPLTDLMKPLGDNVVMATVL